jgi:cell division protein FtsB
MQRIGRLLRSDRRLMARVAATLLFLFAATFWLGYWLAAQSGAQVRASARQLQERVTRLESEKSTLVESVARLETNEKVNGEAYRQVEQQLAELQDKVIQQQEDLAFYRSLVAGPGRGPLRIRRVLVLPGGAPATYRVRLALSQGEKAEREVRGEVYLRLEGKRATRPASLDLAQLAAPGLSPARLQFAFRYFQDLEAVLAIPADFLPVRLVVRVAPSTPGAAPTVESYPWSVATG